MKPHSIKKLVAIFNTCLELDEENNEPSAMELEIAALIADVLIGENCCPYCGNTYAPSDKIDGSLYHCSNCNNMSEI